VSHTQDVVSHTQDVVSHTQDVVSHTQDVVSHTQDVVSCAPACEFGIRVRPSPDGGLASAPRRAVDFSMVETVFPLWQLLNLAR